MKAKFKVGDKVEISSKSKSKLAGQSGSVIFIRLAGSKTYYDVMTTSGERTTITESKLTPEDTNYGVFSSTGSPRHTGLSLEAAKEIAIKIAEKNPTDTYEIRHEVVVARVSATVNVTTKIDMV